MRKRDFFLAALHDGAALQRDWVFSVFSVTTTPETPTRPWEIIRRDGAIYTATPDLTLEPLDDTDPQAPIARFREAFRLRGGELANHPTDAKPIKTTYGNVLVNHLVLVLPFHDKIPFQSGRFDVKTVEAMIEAQLIDDPDPATEAEDADFHAPAPSIYVREYLRYCDYALAMVGYNTIAVQSVSPRSMLRHPAARRLRDELLEKYQGRLHDPAIVARIGDELEALDRQWLADDPTMAFYNANPKKYFGDIRRKLFYMMGAESPFGDPTHVELIPQSLEEGIKVEQLPLIINSLREGSYNRGSQTRFGGEATKTIYRMMGNARIAMDDCQTPLGLPMYIEDGEMAKDLIGFYLIEKGKPVKVTEESAMNYTGSWVEVRSPVTCKSPQRTVCKLCVGDALAELPEGLAAAAAQTGGRFMSAFMAKMHASALKTARYDYRLRLS